MPPARQPQRAAVLLAPAALVLLVVLFFWKLAFTNLIFGRGDTLLYFYPYWTYRAQALLTGRLPLWQPILFMGAPFLANSQAGVLYPFNWPLALLDAPTAVKVSTLFHLAVAAIGAYFFGRRALNQSTLGAFLSASLFTLGGYLTAQVEHVNQLQGLAWLPYQFLAAHALTNHINSANISHSLLRPFRPLVARIILLAAILLALQILAGHTQTAFISLAGVVVYALTLLISSSRSAGSENATQSPVVIIRPLFAFVLLTAAFVLVAVLLTAAQVLPTLELSSQSLREGGLALREALSFSLNPRLLGRALLPGYSRGLFSEFAAYLGVAGLALAVAGLRRSPSRLALAVVAGMGLFFALGGYNPLYALLAALPPFDLFRVPARWLVLFAFGAAQLAGCGLDELTTASSRRRAAMLIVPLALIALAPLASGLILAGETGPLGPPAASDLIGWLAALALLAVLVWLPGRRAWRASAVAALVIVELAVAGRVLPYNSLTAPDVYTSVRPALTQLLSAKTLPVPARFLSMSALRFDPGDLAELRGALDPQLPPDAVYDYIVATKHQEVQSPNLPLAWDLPSVDGYDGGILPLRHYAAFTQLFTGAISSDGRLRENLAAAPDPRLLSLVNARYLISDKVGDAWLDGVFYDLQFTVTLAAGETAQIARVPAFRATALGVVAEAYSGHVAFTFDDGSQQEFRLTGSRIRLPTPAVPVSITLTGPLTIRGLSLVDERSGAFQSLTLGPYRLAHSGDVKVYESLDVLPRAFVAPSAIVLDDEAARDMLADPGFDPAATVILAAPVSPVSNNPPPMEPGAPTATLPATITAYSPEAISLIAEGPGYLLLTDADYPGWTATLDGAPTNIHRADLMFRSITIPPGQHQVEFRYTPVSVYLGLLISSITLAAVTLYLVLSRRRVMK